MDNRKLAESVLEKGYLMSLGTVDDGGVWVSDVIYVHDSEFNIYWISRGDTRHSKAIENNPNVAGTITVSNDPREKDLGLQIAGIAEKVDGYLPILTVEYYIKRRRPLLKSAAEILKGGTSWYKLKPTMVELICEELFDHEKQII